jgi:hypothetical protein
MEFFNDVGSDPLKPSLFELVAQEQLRDLLQPALKYVLAVSSVCLSTLSRVYLTIGICPTISALSPAYREQA